jgi:hypothetical protein
VIINVNKLDNRSKVKKFGTARINRKIGLTNALTSPKTNADMNAFPGESISTPKGNLLIIYRLKAVTIHVINKDTTFIVTIPKI